MAVFKCKICGGSLDITPEMTVGTCQYCGATMTLPRISGDKRANLYTRANTCRRSNDYDRAMGIYETILAEDPSDAEAWWSLVLCKYGVEYVEDPATRKMIPTCNRTRSVSVFDDEDYRQALAHAAGDARILYEDEAEAIDRIQKGILEISNREEPYDVFICYKETDDRNRRTPDSVIAQELYDELVEKGYRVFFSRITLEDKLGEAYEPYIHGALHSARVMVVIGTKAEHFDAVWVKNEWSRYLGLIKGGAKKTLIPAYKDMDIKDLPPSLAGLQAQNMGELGYMQDLLRGIGKIIPKAGTAAVPAAPPVSPVSFGGAPGTVVGGTRETGGRETKLRIDEATQTLLGIFGPPPGGNLVIPGEIKAIAPGAFADTAGIISVTIEDGNLQSIPERAFAGCKDLINFAIPGNLVSIGDEAFSGCTGLRDINISQVTVLGNLRITGNSPLTSIGDRAFEGCGGLVEVVLSGAETLGERAFADCAKLSGVRFGGNVSISRGAFSDCVSLKEVDFYFAAENWNIAEEAFMGCGAIEELEFQEGLRKIRKNAFAGCTGLKDITFDRGCGAEVEAGAFSGCAALENLYIRGPVSITPGAFEGCGKIKDIDFEESKKLKSLAWLAPFFEGGTLPSLNLGGIEEIGEGAFEGCDFLLPVAELPPSSAVSIGKNAFAGLSLKELVIPDDVETIGEGAFARCTALESVIITGYNLESIGNRAFEGCGALKKFVFEYDGLKSIGGRAFEGCRGLAEFAVPGSVTSIEKDAFADCDNLGSIHLSGETAKLYQRQEIVIDHPAVSVLNE